jgi:peptidoglycan/xylan/chitin deacetylase (PgdA/CDA1 family)
LGLFIADCQRRTIFMSRLILAYHRILPKNPERNPLVVTTDQFEQQIKYLLHRTHQSFWITFDDGYQDNFLYAFPILKKYNLTATFFVTTGYIGLRKPFYWDYKNYTSFTDQEYCMTWDQLRQLHAAGMEIGSHTVHHYELTQLTESEIIAELAESKKMLDTNLSQNTGSLCYPRGAYHVALNDLARRSGYDRAVITPSIDNIQETQYTLKRIGIYGHDDLRRFVFKISPLFRLLRRLRRAT